MLSQRNSAIEEKYVAYAASIQLRGQDSRQATTAEEILLNSSDTATTRGERGSLLSSPVFSTLAGVILQSDQERFSRTIFRATRGNAFTEFHQIPEPLRDTETGKDVLKSVFVVYYQGSTTGGSAMSEKISKISQSFSANIYSWPLSETAAIEQIAQADQLMEDKRKALAAYDRFIADESLYLFRIVRDGTGNSLIDEWKFFCAKEKAIYATLNMFEGDVTLRADCWFPAEQEDDIKAILADGGGQRGQRGSVGGAGINAMLLVDAHADYTVGHGGGHQGPPTFIKANDITRSFQLIVDTYGVPRYKEANPALFSIVTFPFLFGVMFGDVGHGFMLMMIGVWAILKSRQRRAASEATGMAIPTPTGFLGTLNTHRYMIFAMGFFSIYAGLMYSEFFAIGLNLFGSRFSCPGKEGSHTAVCIAQYDTSNGGGLSATTGGPYPFGLDPAWSISSNALLFINSMKMKISVLFGVSQMILGIYLKFANSVYFKNMTDLIFECIPQLAFMLAFFGYMDWMIMYKWVTPMNSPPGLIDSMITMGLSGGGVRPGAELYANQGSVQNFLFNVGLISVPLMLIPKPIILWAKHAWSDRSSYLSRRSRNGSDEEMNDRAGLISGSSSAGRKNSTTEIEEFDISEIAIHQAIETIEFVLGTVSHTASYLRLWALSLAHQQLSLVFLQKTLYASMTSSAPVILNAIPIFIAFTIFIGVTVGILLGMDVMECFLHTLRLHWVEFQSKFYKADGVAFKPYEHKRVIVEALGVGSDDSRT